MDYSEKKIKLGLIGRLRVWRAKREAEKTRNWSDKINHEVSEVDYSLAEELELELLIEKARREALKKYKRQGYDMKDVERKEKYVNEYLINIGLKQERLPEPAVAKKLNYVEKVAVKPLSELEEKTMYYQIDDISYKIPNFVSQVYFNQMQKEDYESNYFPALTTDDRKNYIIDKQKMSPERLNGMLNTVIDLSLLEIKEYADLIMERDNDRSWHDNIAQLSKSTSRNKSIAKEKFNAGNVEEANLGLEKKLKEVLESYQDIMKSVQTHADPSLE